MTTPAPVPPNGHPPQGESTILIVDDDRLALALLEHLLSGLGGCRTLCFTGGEDALAWCRTGVPDLVITDHEMPGLTGLDLIARLRQEQRTREVPIMMISSAEDREVRYQSLELGANDFLGKPIDAPEVKVRTRNMLSLRRAQRSLTARSELLAEEVKRATSIIAAREQETILRLSRAAEYRDWETGSHIMRMAHFARIIAGQLGLPEAQQEAIFYATPMHDIGKIGVPDYILLKPGRLDEAEFAIMKKHTMIGYQILHDSSSDLLQLAAEIAISHHEHFDGSGYPQGSKGVAIPLPGRIVAVADVFDALTSERPYKREWQVEAAVATMKQDLRSHFDPECLEAFMRGLDSILTVRNDFKDENRSAQVLWPRHKA
jgi:putative two-component system response regulator